MDMSEPSEVHSELLHRASLKTWTYKVNISCQSHVSWGFFRRYNYKYHTEEKEGEEDSVRIGDRRPTK